jgi:hypothetical protein
LFTNYIITTMIFRHSSNINIMKEVLNSLEFNFFKSCCFFILINIKNLHINDNFIKFSKPTSFQVSFNDVRQWCCTCIIQKLYANNPRSWFMNEMYWGNVKSENFHLSAHESDIFKAANRACMQT